jgi:hypothetical protein
MNKKVIAMAVAAALSAPLAAQAADLKISGRVAADLINNTAGTAFADFGQSRLQFDATDDSGWYARYAQDIRLGRLQSEIGSVGKFRTDREQMVGVKVGGGKLQFGRMGGIIKNIEKDAFIATFLELRNAAVAGGAYGSASFINNNIQYKMKAGGANIGVEYILPDVATVTDTGHYGLAIKGKAGSIGYYLGMNNGDAGTSGATGGVTKAGASMAMGGMDLKLGYDAIDDSSDDTNRIHLGVVMKMGGGKLDVTFADKGAVAGAAFYRVAYMSKVSDSVSWHAGVTSNGSGASANDEQNVGAGVIVKF